MKETASSVGGAPVLIGFVTSHGQTEKIAHVIADDLARRGHFVEVRPCEELTGADLEGRAAVLLGASVMMEGVQPAMRRFVVDHLEALRDRPTAFFQVSGAGGSKLATEREAARRILDEFLRSTGWTPSLRASFGGAINYTRYPLYLKWVMKWISWKNGGSTDTSRDHEYTDWDEVSAFTEGITEMLDRSAVGRARGLGTAVPVG